MENIFKFYNNDKNKVKPDNKDQYDVSKFIIFTFIKELNFNNYNELNKKIKRIENKDENFINYDIEKFENIKQLKLEDIEKFFYDHNFMYGRKEEEKDERLDSSSYYEGSEISDVENKSIVEEDEKDKYKFFDDNDIQEFKIKNSEDNIIYYKGIKYEKDKRKLSVGTFFVSKEDVLEEFQGIIVYYDEENKLNRFYNGIIYFTKEGKEEEFRGYIFNYENDEIINISLTNKFHLFYIEKENELNKIKIIKKNENFREDKSLYEYYYYLEDNYLYKETSNDFICYFNKSLLLNSEDSYYIINFSINKEKFIKNNFILDNETKVKIIFDNNYYYEGTIKPIIENEILTEIQLNDKNGLFYNRLKKRDNNFVYKIEGEFENNKIIKSKVTKRKDGNNFEIFNGEFENNKMKKGVYNFSDKMKYEGEFLDNNCHGKGKFINLFDNVKIKSIEGEFVKGKIKVIESINDKKIDQNKVTIIENIL